jgi:ElaB/YqjD/DUF883 family membrane-anchored ribosome-binding protein
METTVETNSPGNGVRHAKGDEVSGQFKELFDDVEELIKRVADVESPDIQKIRAKARVALVVAKSALKDGALQVRHQARQAASTTDGYVRQSPWQALGLATLFGVAVGLLVARR